MNNNIIKINIADFLKQDINHSYLAEMVCRCGAGEVFVNTSLAFNHEIGEIKKIYQFKEFFFNSEYNSYYIMYIPNKSYIIYDDSSDITIWVCFTEIKERKNGYMTTLLNQLVLKEKGRKIKTDTENKELRKICNKLGISLKN